MAKGVSLRKRRQVLEQIVPVYREASGEHKRQLLDRFTQQTGYHRTYASWLLKQSVQEVPPSSTAHPRRYQADVEQALIFVWKAANCICAKRLIPFLPTLLEALERHGQLQLSPDCRAHLLSMSAATADRLLTRQRQECQRGISTTRAGTLLKRQIPIRTFAHWNETRPGFLEADLVAHCGSSVQGAFLSTLTLTDIATGWTECFPLSSKKPQEVLAALSQAHFLFPFPILGLDTDSGSEFINLALLQYCQHHQITFTRGRPSIKNDQCVVEQKNGQIVRNTVGYARLSGAGALHQLGELYQALRLYVNVFQPSMKLIGKLHEGKKVQRVYDAAKTPWQRVLLSGVLSASQAQELERMAKLLDPLRLFEHLQRLQQALFAAMAAPALVPHAARAFCLQACLSGSFTLPPETDQPTRKPTGTAALPSCLATCEAVAPSAPFP